MAGPRGRGPRTPPTCSTATFVLAVTLVAAAAGIPMSERVSCHVCGGGGEVRGLFPGQPPPPECQPEPDLGLYRECAPNYKGCLTTFDGTTLTRTCGEHAYNPCELANGVLYCYCSGRLCNSQTEAEMRLRRCDQLRLRVQEDDPRRRAPEDDEDAADGSGGSEIPDPFDECLSVTTRRPVPVTQAPLAPTGPASNATTSATDPRPPNPSDDLDLDEGASSRDSLEIAEEGNTTAKADDSLGGDARRARSSAVCVLAALLVALRAWSAGAGAGH